MMYVLIFKVDGEPERRFTDTDDAALREYGTHLLDAYGVDWVEACEVRRMEEIG